MACHAYRPTRKAGAFLAVSGIAVLLLLSPMLRLGFAQSEDPLVRKFVQIAIDDKRLTYDRKLGKVTPEQGRARYNEINARFLQANQELRTRDPKEQDRIRQLKQTLFNIEITPLVQQWEAEFKEKNDAKNAAKGRIVSEMTRDSVVAGQLQAKRTRLRQQQARGQISESDFQAQDKAAEQQIVAMANKYIAAGYGPTFTGLAAHEAEKILKQPPQVAKNSPTVGKPPSGLTPPNKPLPRDQVGSAVVVRVEQPRWKQGEAIQNFLVYGSIVFVGIAALLVFMRRKKAQGDRLPPLTENFGTASFAEMELFPRHPAMTAMGVFLGKSSQPANKNAGLDGSGGPMVTREEHHTLIVARTRTGKGTRVIVPTLLRYIGNMFVIDPKGENAAITARTRRATMQQTIHIVNPWGVMADLYKGYGFQPAAYNPLDILYRNDPNVVATARRLANAICPVTGKGDDLFWQQNSATILTAVFLWLTDQPGETKTLARAREIITLSRKAFTEQFLTKMAVSTAFGGAIREMSGKFIDLADQTYSGIIANLTMTTEFISDPQLKKATNTSTFNVADLRSKPTTVYLVIPPDQIEAQKTWLRLMIAAVTHTFRRESGPEKWRGCMMLIDEFPALGRLQELPTEIATMAGYGLDYTLVVQGIDQLKATYDKDAAAILSNCAYKWYCNVTDLEGAKHLSESLGEATVRTMGKAFNQGTTGGGKDTAGETTNYGEKGRRLFTPDEIINLGRDVAIAFQPEGLPMYLKPIDYWNLTRAFAHLGSIPPLQPLYWKPPLTWDANPYVSQSRGEAGPQNSGSGQSQSGPKPRPENSGSGSAKQDQSQSKPPPGGGGSAKQGQSQSKPPPGGGGGSAKQEQSRPKPPPQPPPMSAEEARKVLNVGSKATKDEIQAAYRRLMAKVHPDHEGSNWMAQKLNEAKVVLLGK